MDDEDRIILAGLGLFGAVAYIAIKELQERNTFDSDGDKTEMPIQEEGFKKHKQETKKPKIYKELLKLTLGNKSK